MLDKIKAWWNGLPTWGKGALLVSTGAVAYWVIKNHSSGSNSDNSYTGPVSTGPTITGGQDVSTSTVPISTAVPTVTVPTIPSTPVTTPTPDVNPPAPSQPTQTQTQPVATPVAAVNNAVAPVMNAQVGASALNAPWVAPVAAVVGGVGGGKAWADNSKQLDEFANGGSRNMGGNYGLDFRGWQPAATGVGSQSYSNSQVSKVTGKTGTVEQQLDGMTQAQKLAALKKAGLI